MFGIPDKHIEQMISRLDENAAEPRLSLIEECGELISALAKFEANRDTYDKSVKCVKEEVAHVLININLVAKAYGIDENDVLKEVVLKGVRNDYDIEGYGWSPKELDMS